MPNDDLPQFPILTTADPQWSIAELFSRNPIPIYNEHPDYFKQMIAEFRAQAERNKAAEEAGRRIPRAPKLADSLPVRTDLTLEEALFGKKTKILSPEELSQAIENFTEEEKNRQSWEKKPQ